MSLPSRFHRGPQRFDSLGKFIESEADRPAMVQTIAGCHEGVGGEVVNRGPWDFG
jgi:hypothetical protein